jgi:regulator of protease activity HflC (stomatin/prohibitin superfamily)
MATSTVHAFSRVKEVAATWQNVRELLRSGDRGDLVPVVIPRDPRGYGFLFWFGTAVFFFISALLSILSGGAFWSLMAIALAVLTAVIGAATWWRQSIVEVEQGTTGILSSWGKIVRTLPPGRKYLWFPWEKVEFIVDTSTEIPYTAPVLSTPTQENVPLKSIEFFLKFRIEEPVAFVRNIGASNFDTVLSSAVQDAIRRRSRRVETAKAYDLRGSDVGDMREDLNRQMKLYGVRITGANIPDVQLPDQYQQDLATREKVAKELSAYEKEWDLIRKRRTDGLELEIEKAKKERDAKRIKVRESINKARQDVALMLEEKKAEAEKIKLEIEAHGTAQLRAAENEAKALQSLGETYRDNRALLQYQLEGRRLEVAESLMSGAPRPVVITVPTQSGGETSALTTLMLAQMLPETIKQPVSLPASTVENGHSVRDEAEDMLKQLMKEVSRRTGKT